MEHVIFFFGTLALAIGIITWIMWYFGMHKDYSGNKLPETKQNKTSREEELDGF